MRLVLITALVLLPGCAATVADLRAGTPFMESASQRSVSDLSGCIGQAWQSRSGVVNSVPREAGFTMTLSYPVMGQVLVAAAVDVDDRGDSRRVVVHARKGDAGPKLRTEIEKCL